MSGAPRRAAGLTALTFSSRLKSRPLRKVRAFSQRQKSKWSGWQNLAHLVNMRMALGGVQALVRARDAAQQAQARGKASVLEVDYAFQAGDLQGAVPYWQQGDMDMYTEANLAKRYKLRHDRGVLDVLQLVLRSPPHLK